MKLRQLIVVMLAGVLTLGLAGSALAWGKKEVATEAMTIKFHEEVVRGGYQVVSTAELKKWKDQGKKMLIIDTMPFEKSFKKNHIPGAVQFLFPIPEMTEITEEEKAKFVDLLGTDKGRTLVFYCGFTKCSRSHNGAMWAKKLGYSDVWRCPGGIVGWKEQGFPAEKVK